MTAIESGWLRLPGFPRVVFARTPLALAICQVRYPTMLNLSNPSVVAPFQAAIQDDYPIASSLAQLGMTVAVQGGQLASLQSQQPVAHWRFADAGDDWAVVLAPDFVSLETRSYVGFADFLDRLGRVVEAVAQTVRPRVYTRVGLRYVNELRPGHTAWPEVVRVEMLGPMAEPLLSDHVGRWAQQILLEGPNGERLTVQHGVSSEGTTVEPRPGDESPEGPFYLLDLDASREFARAALPPLVPDAIAGQVRSLHDLTSTFFRWAVTESFAKTLGVHTDANP